MLRFVVGPEHAHQRLDRLVTEWLEDTSRSSVQRWIEEGRVTVGGRRCRAKDTPREGEVVEVRPGPAPPSTAEPDASVVFAVVYEDEHLIVVDKPAGLVVHPARGHRSRTLVNGLLARPGFRRAPSDPRDLEGHTRPGIVHRLDRDTSGLLVVAKDEVAREGLKAQLSARAVEREYTALTIGVPPAGAIRTAYGRHPQARVKFSSLVREGRAAVTHVSVQAVLAEGRAAHVSCRLETGRTHQIRVHLAEQPHTPILADRVYGRAPADPWLVEAAGCIGRQALHARTLGFVHPVTRQPLRFSAPLPDDFARALECLSRGSDSLRAIGEQGRKAPAQ